MRESDIGIMPLYDSKWELGKCGYKLIQYMACGLPVIGSAVGANNEIIRAGTNGWLVSSDEEWKTRLIDLLSDEAARERFGKFGRELVEVEYSTDLALKKITAILRRIT